MEPQNLTFHDAVIDFLPDATLVIDRDGRVIAWNNAMEVLTGVPAVSMLGKGDYEYALPFYKKRRPILANLVFLPEVEIAEKYDSVERIGDTLVVDIFIPDFQPGGVYLWAKASPLYDPQGNVTGAIETIRDITDRKRAEQEMARTTREMAEIIDFLPDATLVIDRDGKVIAWNNAMERLTGISAESMLGKGDYEYALPFYKERRPMLANLVFMPEVEIEKRYDSVERIGDTLVVDIFIPDFQPGGYSSGPRQARCMTRREMSPVPSRRFGTSPTGNVPNRRLSAPIGVLPISSVFFPMLPLPSTGMASSSRGTGKWRN